MRLQLLVKHMQSISIDIMQIFASLILNARKRFVMIIKHNQDGTQQIVYEFFTQDKYATSFPFKLPSMGIWRNHEHPWIVILRETSRCVTTNWSDLNDLLTKLIVFEKQFPGKWPSKTTLMEWLGSYSNEGNYTFSWFNYPTDMEEN